MKLIVREKLIIFQLSQDVFSFFFFKKTKSSLAGLQRVALLGPFLSKVNSGLSFGVSRRAVG